MLKLQKLALFITTIFYIVLLYQLYAYKYQTPVSYTDNTLTANGKSIFVIGLYSLFCTMFIILIIYFYTKSSSFSLLSVYIYSGMYVLLLIAFVIEKFISKTLLPDRLNSHLETLVYHPFILVVLLGAYQIYQDKSTTNLEIKMKEPKVK
ncbi:MAG: hypothetical protein EAZ20_00520 [Bacteroidetes bacterium]|nr:MAG: hypothetical protein EAZ20_00520 [Bacteroidota bacterium]